MDFFGWFRKPSQQAATSAPLRRRFAGAAIDRTTASWQVTSATINQELKTDLDALRMRSRDLARNNDLGRRFVKLVSRNIVGSKGVILQARVVNPDGTPDSLANRAIEARWFAWGKRGSAEVSGQMDWVGLCRAVVQTVAEDGEALVAIVRGKYANNPEGIAFQLIDTGRLDTRKNREAGKNQTAIIMGVEVDGANRPIAYWLREHQNSATSSPVPAKDLIHVFDADRPEQLRGVPWMHASMLAIHDLGEFTKSALLNARRSADVLGYLVSPDGTASAMADTTDDESQAIKISAPGTYDVLPDGYDIRSPDFAYPNTIFEPFTKAIMRRVAVGMDIAAHNLTGDMTDVTYSSARIAELEERDMWQTRQDWFISAFIEPVFAEWFKRAMVAGTIKMPNGSALPVAKAEKFAAHEWQARRWAWVDPMKDMQASVLAIQSGLASPQQIAAQQGMDLEDIINAISAANAMAEAAGLPKFGAPPAPAPVPEQEAARSGDVTVNLPSGMIRLDASIQPPAARRVKRIPVRDEETGMIVEIHEVEEIDE